MRTGHSDAAPISASPQAVFTQGDMWLTSFAIWRR
jgi:hypothetical protein